MSKQSPRAVAYKQQGATAPLPKVILDSIHSGQTVWKSAEVGGNGCVKIYHMSHGEIFLAPDEMNKLVEWWTGPLAECP